MYRGGSGAIYRLPLSWIGPRSHLVCQISVQIVESLSPEVSQSRLNNRLRKKRLLMVVGVSVAIEARGRLTELARWCDERYSSLVVVSRLLVFASTKSVGI